MLFLYHNHYYSALFTYQSITGLYHFNFFYITVKKLKIVQNFEKIHNEFSWSKKLSDIVTSFKFSAFLLTSHAFLPVVDVKDDALSLVR